ncbi:MAG TPA: caspase family protein [Thiotrichaceae bacterium]|nr:caspase family protein [Thiotrichaceae bacterium]
MNIAVAIGISNYENIESLPACSTDALKMKELLEATGKYAEVVSLTNDTSARKIKSLLRNFFKNYQDEQIDEAFFYFSGHGTYQNDVLFCCSDFDSKRPATTSLPNLEIDDLMRNVSPKLVVKVLDACSSGAKYIKDTKETFEKAFRSAELESFICLASSHLNQSSYATDKLSFFTQRFMQGALAHDEGPILYRDIQSYISDAFIETPEQTPFFVSQGSGLEVFATVTPSMASLKQSFFLRETEELPADLDTTIESKIKELGSFFVPHEKVIGSLETLLKILPNLRPENSLISKYYSYEFVFTKKLESLVSMEEIARLASERKWSQYYFVEIITEKRRSSSFYLSALMALNAAYGRETPGYVIKDVPISIKSTLSLPFETIEIIARPNKSSLKQLGALIGIVHSRTDVLILTTIIVYKNVGWDEQVIDASTVEWAITEYKWKDIVSDPIIITKNVLSQLENEIFDYLKSFSKKKVTNIELSKTSKENFETPPEEDSKKVL